MDRPELTIACTSYRWDPERSPAESELGIVPIGFPYRGMNVLVADKDLNEVNRGAEGELLMNEPPNVHSDIGGIPRKPGRPSSFLPGGRIFSTALEIASVGP